MANCTSKLNSRNLSDLVFGEEDRLPKENELRAAGCMVYLADTDIIKRLSLTNNDGTPPKFRQFVDLTSAPLNPSLAPLIISGATSLPHLCLPREQICTTKAQWMSQSLPNANRANHKPPHFVERSRVTGTARISVKFVTIFPTHHPRSFPRGCLHQNRYRGG